MLRIGLPLKLRLDAHLILVLVIGVVLMRIIYHGRGAGDGELGSDVRKRQLLQPTLAICITIDKLGLVLGVERSELDWLLLHLYIVTLIRAERLPLLNCLWLQLKVPARLIVAAIVITGCSKIIIILDSAFDVVSEGVVGVVTIVVIFMYAAARRYLLLAQLPVLTFSLTAAVA